MKNLFTLILLVVLGQSRCDAQWAVIDVPNLVQSVANYAIMGEQLAKQATEITNQVQQIQQFETQLKRLGDMASVKNLLGFPEFSLDLQLPSKIKLWADGSDRVDGRGLFGDTRGGIYLAIGADFRDFDGESIERNPTVYKDSQAITATVDEFKTVQADVYTRRENLKRAIGVTSAALEDAGTEAEEQKLAAILDAQYGELAAVDSEVTLSAAQVQVKAAESVAMGNAQSDADAEARRRLAQEEVKKISNTFKPQYECLLQYVTEKRFSP